MCIPKQFLVDHRDIHAKEKDFFVEEVKRLSKKNDCEFIFIQDGVGNFNNLWVISFY